MNRIKQWLNRHPFNNPWLMALLLLWVGGIGALMLYVHLVQYPEYERNFALCKKAGGEEARFDPKTNSCYRVVHIIY